MVMVMAGTFDCLARIFYIESKFIALSESSVLQYRRIVAPWFYFNLNTKEYRFESNHVVWFYGIITRKACWLNSKTGEILYEFSDGELLKFINDAAQNFACDSVCSLK